MKRPMIAAFALIGLLSLMPAMALDSGDAAPALVLRQLDGKEFDLAAQKGHVVLVNLWATWCQPCRDEMPVLDRFYVKHEDQGVVVRGMDGPLGAGEEVGAVKAAAGAEPPTPAPAPAMPGAPPRLSLD